jgi:hypothetical protein
MFNKSLKGFLFGLGVVLLLLVVTSDYNIWCG